ncbi:hypothetical protein K435DRAFT_865835 [Dendrothele bispora CBS 962.96]|uniref:Fungal-type protein kinase domain-containing protein n=1 Tax=Dendrothele bispora (strain CBS 962.96) TaxID=1314807 RepID=A0A4S8LIM3_DENBC|nr:hypothetical protein K435DRAFT_865835 [Dendrothele bispora CBS 962.96]
MDIPCKINALDRTQSSVLTHHFPDLENPVYSGIDVRKFVQNVWSITDEECERLFSLEWKIESTLLFDYAQLIIKKSPETSYYPVFQAIVHDLLKRYLQELKVDRKIIFWQSNGGRKNGSLKPDMLTLWQEMADPVWGNTKCPIKFKSIASTRGSVNPTDPYAAPKILKSEPLAIPIATKPCFIKTVMSMNDACADKGHQVGLTGNKIGAILETEVLVTPDGSMSSTASNTDIRASSTSNVVSGSKRKRDREDEGGQLRKKFKVLTKDQSQLASYALECFMADSRFYVPGLFIDKEFVTLWYYDRMGAIISSSFNFLEEPKLLGLVLYALNQSNPSHSGYNRFLRRRESSTSSSNQLPPDSIKNARFEFPPHYSSSETKGSTRVFDVVDKPLYAYSDIVGRGSGVYPVSEVLPDGSLVPDLVIKFSWPSTKRLNEVTLLTHLRDECPELRPYVPELIFSAKYDSGVDLQLPRFGIRPAANWKQEGLELRDLVVLVTRKYQHLSDVKTLEEFKSVFIDLVEAHHRAYKKGHILHRDLSLNNLMFGRDKDGKARGILNDWDLSSAVDEDGKVKPSDAKHRTGTLPFMAIPLLLQNDEPHLYRHELESFLYVLIWAGLHYHLNGKQLSIPHRKVKNWNVSKFRTCADAKRSLMLATGDNAQFFKCFTAEFQPLVDIWARPLLELFQTAYLEANLNPVRKSESLADWDTETMGGHLTFENFMKALKCTPPHNQEVAPRCPNYPVFQAIELNPGSEDHVLAEQMGEKEEWGLTKPDYAHSLAVKRQIQFQVGVEYQKMSNQVSKSIASTTRIRFDLTDDVDPFTGSYHILKSLNLLLIRIATKPPFASGKTVMSIEHE